MGFGRVNIQKKIHIINSSYFSENKRIRFKKDIDKLFIDGQLGLKNNPYICNRPEFMCIINELIHKYNGN